MRILILIPHGSNYLKSSGEQRVDTDRVHLDYKFEGHNWEDEAKKVINDTMRLV